MRRDPATRGAILELAMQVDLSTGEERLWFGVIRQAVDDLTGTWLRTGKADYPAEQYFGSQKFREDAYACGLEPEYVLDVLRRYNLLREDGSAVREFIAADTEDAAAFLGDMKRGVNQRARRRANAAACRTQR